MNGEAYGADEEELRSDLVDLAGLDLDRLAELPDSALARALRRIRDQVDDSADSFYLAFQAGPPAVDDER